MASPARGARVRVFISYSTTDRLLVDPLKAALARSGADVWLDHERLTPGELNWQNAVRDGIAQAEVVIYAASESRRSLALCDP